MVQNTILHITESKTSISLCIVLAIKASSIISCMQICVSLFYSTAWIDEDRDHSDANTISSPLAAISGIRLGVDLIDMRGDTLTASQPASITSLLLNHLIPSHLDPPTGAPQAPHSKSYPHTPECIDHY